ncbi:MAG: tRNA uracil 4-sulfurtransferase ThiI [Spirochaetales bacterium]
MNKVILIRYSEIHLKGKNRGFFEKRLKHNLKRSLSGFECNITFEGSRYIVSNFDESMLENIVDRVKSVFGVHSFSVADELDTTVQNIENYFYNYKLKTKTFKVDTNRADKTFPIKSCDFSAQIGGMILDNNEGCTVDLHHPQTVVSIDIREHKKTYIFDSVIKAYSGMPVGTSGKGLALLSGGIDSPVAIFKMASRGMAVNAIHFHSFPYTSEQAKQKVIDLAKVLTKYTGNMRVFVVPFTKIQESIHKYCMPEYMITLMRRFMVRIAEKVAENYGGQALITGENLAQVASQTVESLTSTQDAVGHLPIFRPLIASNKEDIVTIAKEIGTYDLSILPYEDCCTVFLPKNPLIKPHLDKVKAEESKLDVDTLIDDAIKNIEVVDL